MAISTQRSLSELQKECENLGLKVELKAGQRKLGKTDYVLALRQWHLDHDFPNGVPEELTLMLSGVADGPMLCSRVSELKPDEQKAIWDDPMVIAQQKEDGVRAVLPFIDGKLHMFSRNISVKDFLPVDYSENLWLEYCQEKLDKITDKFIVDSECVSLNPHINTIMGKKGVVTESQLQAVTALLALNSQESIAIQRDENAPIEFRIFDCLWYNGEWLMDKPLIERQKYTEKAILQFQAAGLKCRQPVSNYTNKLAFYKAMLAAGNEGVVLKYLDSPYITGSNRSKRGWLKCKRKMTEAMQGDGLADTLDAFVSGYEESDEDKSWAGLVGALEFSVHLKCEDGSYKDHKIARVTNIPMDLRREVTELDENGRPRLKKDWYGRVASIDGQCVSARALRLKHAVLVDWRPDRSEETCVLEESYLKKMVL